MLIILGIISVGITKWNVARWKSGIVREGYFEYCVCKQVAYLCIVLYVSNDDKLWFCCLPSRWIWVENADIVEIEIYPS